MTYGFDTTDETAACAAVLVYAIYRSRDAKKFKVSPDMWSQIERFTKDAAKRSRTIPAFLDALKPRLSCGAIQPRWMRVGLTGEMPLVTVADGDGRIRSIIQFASGEDDTARREFLTRLIDRADHRAVISRLYRETAWVVLLVRDRLERERTIEDRLGASDTDENTETERNLENV